MLSTVSGRFKTADIATGTIRYSEKMIPPSPGFARASCTSKVTFTAVSAAVPAGRFHKTSPTNGASIQSTVPKLRWRASNYAAGSVLPRHDQQQPVRRRMGLHEDADLRQPHGPEARYHLPLAGEGVHCPQNGRRGQR